jgi:hypothetical protein
VSQYCPKFVLLLEGDHLPQKLRPGLSGDFEKHVNFFASMKTGKKIGHSYAILVAAIFVGVCNLLFLCQQ